MRSSGAPEQPSRRSRPVRTQTCRHADMQTVAHVNMQTSLNADMHARGWGSTGRKAWMPGVSAISPLAERCEVKRGPDHT